MTLHQQPGDRSPVPLNAVCLNALTPQPWRNGGGTTQELLAWPQADDWMLRLSVARIEQAGPFSAFPGIQRHFCVLSGAGVRLQWPQQLRTLKPGSGPCSFDGGDSPDCELIDGATTDLNLMVRTDAGHGSLQAVSALTTWRSAASWRGVYAAQDCTLYRNDDAQGLPANSLHWSCDAADEVWHFEAIGSFQAWWIEFQARAPTTGVRP